MMLFRSSFNPSEKGAPVGADLFNLQHLLHALQLKIVTGLLQDLLSCYVLYSLCHFMVQC